MNSRGDLILRIYTMISSKKILNYRYLIRWFYYYDEIRFNVESRNDDMLLWVFCKSSDLRNTDVKSNSNHIFTYKMLWNSI
jgi:hypothetical protein